MDRQEQKKTVRVAAAVIYDGDRYFATQRGYGDWKDFWEFPGGKIEPGETPEEALVREIREELETEISIAGRLAEVEYDYPEFHLSMVCYIARISEGQPVLKEHEAARWLKKEELDEVGWLPADRFVVEMLKLY
ncbi:MAG: (deoxy)nucleoside triphosphate pyrophosphohydrolase [Lachnospiraceae bacterium]|nr:(deoxy)nucleoside triphosphate pyrophosphohydrolase [Lachnospiraceae bacterium]